jgi:hypothetical protein
MAFNTPKHINKVVYAEIPDPSWDPMGQLRALLTSYILHGLCGDDNPQAPYMVRKHINGPLICSKRFPKPFTDRTLIHKDGYPKYYRRDIGQVFTVRKPGFLDVEVVRDNRWVVLYNLYLL